MKNKKLTNSELTLKQMNKYKVNIDDFEKLTEEFRNKISINIYNQVIYTNNKSKLIALRNFIKK